MSLQKEQNQNYLQIKINNIDCAIPKDFTILQACEYIGIEIPRFCYHRELLIAGNCRMCLVELEKSPKPVASCAMQIMPGMSIYTDTPLVRKAREGVLEFLLLNHPLDCPICDQGGECDLQDQSILYGSDRSRFYDFKRSVEDKNCGPLIKTIMTRCIHCTRCVRFIDEVGGNPILGTTNRGNHTEIGTYINLNINSELSGNLIDLCPVGALTSKPYAFRARSWELKNKSTIDLFDSLGSNTVSNIRGTKIMRVMPGINPEINREWISDKARFSFDAFDVQRLTKPYIRKHRHTTFVSNENWKDVCHFMWRNVKDAHPTKIMAVTGQFVNAETQYLIKKIFCEHGTHDIFSENQKLNHNIDFLNNNVFSKSLTNFDDHDLCLIIGSNLKHEAPVLNSQLRKRYIKGDFEIYSLGANNETNTPITHIGFNVLDLIQIIQGKHIFSKKLAQAKNPTIIVSAELFNKAEGKQYFELLNILKAKLNLIFKSWDSLNILHKTANDLNAIELGYRRHSQIIFPQYKRIIFLFGTENYLKTIEDKVDLGLADIVYVGHHGTPDAQRANFILPSFSPVEESGIYVNTEGRAQISEKLIKNELNHRRMWGIVQIINIIYRSQRKLDHTATLFNSFNEVRENLLMDYPLTLNKKKTFMVNSTNNSKIKINFNQNLCIKPFTSFVENFYLNDSISKHSPIMSKTSTQLRVTKNFI